MVPAIAALEYFRSSLRSLPLTLVGARDTVARSSTSRTLISLKPQLDIVVEELSREIGAVRRHERVELWVAR